MMENRKNIENVDINNPAFKEIFDALNIRIKAIMDKIYEGKDFASGDITLKITLGTMDNAKDFVVIKNGELTNKKYEYKSLDVKHSITTTLKQTDKAGGEYIGQKELVKSADGEYVEIPVRDSQMNMFDK